MHAVSLLHTIGLLSLLVRLDVVSGKCRRTPIARAAPQERAVVGGAPRREHFVARRRVGRVRDEAQERRLGPETDRDRERDRRQNISTLLDYEASRPAGQRGRSRDGARASWSRRQRKWSSADNKHKYKLHGYSLLSQPILPCSPILHDSRSALAQRLLGDQGSILFKPWARDSCEREPKTRSPQS